MTPQLREKLHLDMIEEVLAENPGRTKEELAKAFAVKRKQRRHGDVDRTMIALRVAEGLRFLAGEKKARREEEESGGVIIQTWWPAS